MKKSRRKKEKRESSIIGLMRELREVQRKSIDGLRSETDEVSSEDVPNDAADASASAPQDNREPEEAFPAFDADPADMTGTAPQETKHRTAKEVLAAGEAFSDRVADFVDRPEAPKKPSRVLLLLKDFFWPTAKTSKPKKPLHRMDDPALSTQQRIWIAVQTILLSVLPLLLYLVLPGFIMCIGMLLRHWNGDTEAFVNASGNFYYAVGIVLCFFMIRWKIVRGGESFRDAITLYLDAPDFRKAGHYAVFGIAASIFLSAVFTLLPFFTSYKAVTESAFQRTDLGLAMLSVLVTAPICEEVIFRGLMLNRMLSQFPEKTAVFLSAVLFAVCHGNLAWSCYAFLMGVLLGFVSIKEDNIFYSIVLHMAFNLWTVLQLLIRQSESLQSFLFGSRGLIAVYGLLAFLIMLAWIRMHPDFTEAAGTWLQKKERT